MVQQTSGGPSLTFEPESVFFKTFFFVSLKTNNNPGRLSIPGSGVGRQV